MSKTVIIIGAGPAGLTAAFELLKTTDMQPIVIEQSQAIGGISQTLAYKGNKMDIGPHRFFSKSDVVMNLWKELLPIEEATTQNTQKMLVVNRLTRIFYLRKFFDYPITINRKTLSNLGFIRLCKVAWSYLWIRAFPLKKTETLEDFFINRFGKELYNTFFKDYTEKLWGVPCHEIAADWGAQRVKELSISKALLHALKTLWKKEKSLEQKNTQTSLIEKFLYPALGAGQMWETMAKQIEQRGGKIIKNAKVVKIHTSNNSIESIVYKNISTGEEITLKGDYFLSSMPVQELITAIQTAPEEVKKISDGLLYRDLILVGLLVNKFKIGQIPDNWIYVQEREVRIGRMEVFNNFSPYMVADPSKIWLTLEYFCNEGDSLWQKDDKTFIQFAIEELQRIDIIDEKEVVDSCIHRTLKAYPAYFGSYSQFHQIRNFTDSLENLFLIGRNGMHKYNNMDHSMLTAISAIDHIRLGKKTKEAIWDINTEEEYHEEKKNVEK